MTFRCIQRDCKYPSIGVAVGRSQKIPTLKDCTQSIERACPCVMHCPSAHSMAVLFLPLASRDDPRLVKKAGSSPCRCCTTKCRHGNRRHHQHGTNTPGHGPDIFQPSVVTKDNADRLVRKVLEPGGDTCGFLGEKKQRTCFCKKRVNKNTHACEKLGLLFRRAKLRTVCHAQVLHRICWDKFGEW